MASKVINTILNLRDQFSPTIQNVAKNTDHFRKSMRQTENQALAMKRNVANSFQGMKGTIAAVVGGIGIFEMAKQSLELASNLNEVQNVVDTTFGGMASKINEFASTTSSQFGVSELQAKKYAGTLGAMLKSAGFAGDELTNMSTTLSGLAGDMASFYNLNPDEAFGKLKSGISGETEPLKELGVDISDTTVQTYAMAKGFNKQWSSATQAEKELWRYKSIMEQTKDSQGDYNKTSSGFANQLRTMKLNFQTLGANIMSYTIPAFEGLFKTINDTIKNIDIKSIMNSISGAIDIVKPSVEELWGSIKDLATTVWNSVIPAFDSVKPDKWTSVGDAIKDIVNKATEVVKYVNDNWPTIKPVIEDIISAMVAWKLATMAVNTWITITTAAQWALNFALNANPIGVIIMAIAGLGFAIYEVIKHWKDIYNWITWVWGIIEKNPILHFLSYVLNPFGSLLMDIITHWKDISTAIGNAWDKLKNFWNWWNNTSFNDKNINVTESINQEKLTQGATSDFADTFNAAYNASNNATGTNYWRGGRTWVGEHGPELINLPGGSKVYTNSQSRQMSNGQSQVIINFNVSGNMIGEEEFFNRCGQHVFNQVQLSMVNS
ncbi:hypothetical protein [Clostridium saccharoperbutylacetonicum]|uniref:hypothetical protein n=1 Tax=Clostridium saccharoperbutylacetonicum TaxID=36745 RepID=UPI0039EAA345